MHRNILKLDSQWWLRYYKLIQYHTALHITIQYTIQLYSTIRDYIYLTIHYYPLLYNTIPFVGVLLFGAIVMKWFGSFSQITEIDSERRRLLVSLKSCDCYPDQSEEAKDKREKHSVDLLVDDIKERDEILASLRMKSSEWNSFRFSRFFECLLVLVFFKWHHPFAICDIIWNPGILHERDDKDLEYSMNSNFVYFWIAPFYYVEECNMFIDILPSSVVPGKVCLVKDLNSKCTAAVVKRLW